LTDEELAIVLADSEARLVFTEHGIADTARSALASFDDRVILVELGTDASGDGFDELPGLRRASR
jgi:hypothetical protein